jgi:hypothetical protein
MDSHSTAQSGLATRPWTIWTSNYSPEHDTFSASFSKANQALARPGKMKPRRLPARHPVVCALENVGYPVTNGELARLMGVSDGEASKRWREVAHLLDVARIGKERRIRLKCAA